jgi:pyruvate dehydrogenase (quinone)
LRGIYCDDPAGVRSAWEQALASDVPVVLEFKVDSEIPPIPPHIMSSQAKKAATAMLSDPERVGIGVRGFRQKLTDFYEKLPGRDRG